MFRNMQVNLGQPDEDFSCLMQAEIQVLKIRKEGGLVIVCLLLVLF